jgi:hypothetical protein
MRSGTFKMKRVQLCFGGGVVRMWESEEVERKNFKLKDFENQAS